MYRSVRRSLQGAAYKRECKDIHLGGSEYILVLGQSCRGQHIGALGDPVRGQRIGNNKEIFVGGHINHGSVRRSL